MDIQKAKENGIDTSGKYWGDFPTKYRHGSILFEKEAEAIRYADRVINQFNELFSKELEAEFLNKPNKPLEKLCKRFVRSILLPLNKEIIFTENSKLEALSIDEYFKTKMEAKERKIKEVKSISNDEIIQKVNQEIE